MKLARCFIAIFFIGLIAMSTTACGDNAIELFWQWPNDRPPASLMTIEVSGLSKQRSGFFGLGRSPSLVKNLPEATEVTGKVLLGGRLNQSIRIVVPGPEIPSGLRIGERVDLQLFDDKTCIGLLRSDS